MRKKTLLVLALALVIRLIYLKEIPESLFGDVIYHLNLAKNFSVVRWGGDGAMFPLITSIITRLIGFKFLTLKLISVTLSVLMVWATILYVSELTKSKKAGLYAGLLMTSSFWSISISHIGKPIVLVPLFAALIGYFLLKKRFVVSGILIGLSLYTQAAAWGLFLLSFAHPLTLLASIVAGFFFFRELTTAPDTFFSASSHIGEKLQINSYSVVSSLQIVGIILYNLLRQVRGLFIFGDKSFRTTVPGQPLLDPITGFFLIAGVVFGILTLKKIINSPEKGQMIKKLFWPIGVCLIIPFFLIQLPAILDIHNLVYIPNNERISGVMPFIFAIAGYGLWKLEKQLNISKKIKTALVGFIFVLIVSINLYRYWVIYPKTLPNHNVAFAEEIGKRTALIDSSTPVFVIGSGWGEWGQPEGNAFEFVDAGRRKLPNSIESSQICNYLPKDKKEAVFLTSPTDFSIGNTVNNCGWRVSKKEMVIKKGQNISQFFFITKP
ncbi:hypothetical protein A2690_05085 [Candidatus Roizmanbacteria bacterium RIFCSPHIGHO2_01_FULL_39_12b]|uniref:Glycosyltransferase RgtA/B/C/D-like domain-containing protein n=1 Tax=Candidatus Roizmanbacteria bacterium RIFCSPHIGHO2_01_FULL_39_12b TaxID=1802030 RepID=A0A1F7G923_9BACT|nr:MAG: hypothetical protein A2690_05085 [Candidatus Roizmanbacteria bacterium RIFCSPHIGHO2_01_FULL_39_12b]OGK45914.1 MAG: hypothetical protein A3B46_03405 [Candidatus Roizmanbacteria bacterium RIFCSPLOWO2_01_FULL_39_19]